MGVSGTGEGSGGGLNAALPTPCPSPQANDYTVEVAQDPGLEEAVDTMRLRLLRQGQARERFQNYRASVLCD